MFKFGMPTLVVRKFNIDENGSDGKYIELSGRPSGLLSWLLTLMKLDTVTTLKLEKDRLSVKSSSLSGEIHTVMPLGAIESTQCGFSKSLSWLLIGTFIIISGILSGDGGAFFLSLIVGIILFIIYFFSKKMFISVSAGDTTVSIGFKKGVIEGVTVDLERTKSAIELLNDKIVKENSK